MLASPSKLVAHLTLRPRPDNASPHLHLQPRTIRFPNTPNTPPATEPPAGSFPDPRPCSLSPPLSQSSRSAMGWPYEFVSLSKEEKHARRDVLDLYGRIAHLSALGPGLILALVLLSRQAIRYAHRRRGDSSDGHGSYAQIPRSPLVKAHRRSARGSIEAAWTTVTWWMCDDVRFLGSSWGQRGEWIFGIAWMAWLLALCVRQTGKGMSLLLVSNSLIANMLMTGYKTTFTLPSASASLPFPSCQFTISYLSRPPIHTHISYIHPTSSSIATTVSSAVSSTRSSFYTSSSIMHTSY